MSDDNESAGPAAAHWYDDAGRFFQSAFRLVSRNAMPTIGAATLVAILVAKSRRSHPAAAPAAPTSDNADSATPAAAAN